MNGVFRVFREVAVIGDPQTVTLFYSDGILGSDRGLHVCIEGSVPSYHYAQHSFVGRERSEPKTHMTLWISHTKLFFFT